MASFFPKKLSSRKIDFSSEKTTVKVSIYSLLVIATPNGNAPAMECVHNMKTHILCSSVFEDESTDISSDNCCIYEKEADK